MGQSDFVIVGNVLKRYTGSDQVVVVPPGVEEIGERAFRNNETLERVVLPEGVRKIRAQAFQGCWSLEEAELPDSLEVLQREVFAGCIMLHSLRIPPQVTRLPVRAFQGGLYLSSLELPRGIQQIGEKVLERCDVERLAVAPGTVPLSRSFFRWLLQQEPMRLEIPGVPLQAFPEYRYRIVLRGMADWEFRGHTLTPEQEADVQEYLSDAWPYFLGEAAVDPALLSFLLRRKVITAEGADELLSQMDEAKNKAGVAALLEYRDSLPEKDPALQDQPQELEPGFLSEEDFDVS